MATEQVTNPTDVFGKLDVDRFGVITLEALKNTPVPENVKPILPGAKSIVVLMMELLPEVVRLLSSRAQTGELNLRTLYNRNIQLVSGRIDWESYKLVKELHKYGFSGIPLPADGAPFDNRFLKGTISYHRIAEMAGMGVTGWHSMLLTPEYGPRVRLACVLTSAPLEELQKPLMENIFCKKCGGACVKICPASAIKEPQGNEVCHVDKFACNNYLSASGGCSECMKVCPVGKNIP